MTNIKLQTDVESVQTQQAIFEQKARAKYILNRIKLLDPRAIIAGGAARDWYFGNVANDIDIFYYSESQSCEANVSQQKNLLQEILGVKEMIVLGFNPEKDDDYFPRDDFTNYLLNPDIVNVFECVINGLKFQFIQLSKRNVDVSKFAYNMCQAWSDGDKVWTTYKFDVGVRKEILLETGELYAHTDKFKQKMIAKFPNYEYVGK